MVLFCWLLVLVGVACWQQKQSAVCSLISQEKNKVFFSVDEKS
jgi:hypothetical protein